MPDPFTPVIQGLVTTAIADPATNNDVWTPVGWATIAYGVSSVSGSAPIASSGGATPVISLNLNGVTNAYLRQGAALTVIGRSANSTGNVADIAAGSDGDVLRRSGTTLGFGSIPESSVTSLVSDLAGKVPTTRAVNTTAPLAGGGALSGDLTLTTSMATARLIGRNTAGTGVMEEISLGTGLSFSGTTLNGTAAYTDEQAQDAVGTILTDSATIDFTYNDAGNTITAIVIDNSIADAKLRQGGALTVIGRSANSTGNVADIAAGSDGDVLRRSGTTLGFGSIPEGSVTNLTTDLAAKVPTTRAVNTTSPLSGGGALSGDLTLTTSISSGVLVGRTTASSGVMEQITPNSSRLTLTAGTIDITTNGVGNSQIRQSVKNTVIGRSANTTGDVADIQATTDGDVFRLSGTTLGFGSIPEASVTGLVADLALKAPLASPTFTGTPAAPTAAVDTNTTQLATTAFVLAQAASASPAAPSGTLGVVGTSTRYARGDHAHPITQASFKTTADQSLTTSNTTLQNITGASFAIGANETWDYTVHLFSGNSITTTGCDIGVTVPSGASVWYTMESYSADSAGNNGVPINSNNRATAGGTKVSCPADGSTPGNKIHHVITIHVENGATPGNVQMQACQQTSSATVLKILNRSYGNGIKT